MHAACRRPGNRNSGRGFTLIELLVAITIIGILAAVAVPQYNEYIVKGRLAEATSELSNFQLRIEQYYQDNRTYARSGAACGTGGDCGVCPTAASTNWTFTCATSNSGQQFSATAVSTTLGFTFTINEAGAKSTTIAAPSNWTAGTSSCWVRSKSGAC